MTGGHHEAQRTQHAQRKDRRGEERADDRPRSHRHRRLHRDLSITNEAVDELKLAAGQTAYAVVKASDVMIAID